MKILKTFLMLVLGAMIPTLLAINAIQGHTVEQQRVLILEMTKNPNCMVPYGGATPRVHEPVFTDN